MMFWALNISLNRVGSIWFSTSTISVAMVLNAEIVLISATFYTMSNVLVI
jgi:hypothetical protein